MGWLNILLKGKKVAGKALKKAETKASKFGEKAIKEASTPGKKIKGWSKIALPGVPFHIKKILEGPHKD